MMLLLLLIFVPGCCVVQFVWSTFCVIRPSVLHALKLETNMYVCERAVSSEVRIDKHHLIAE